MAIDRRSACLHQAALCKQRSATEPARRNYWLAEAHKWSQRADEEVGEVVLVIDRKRPVKRA
ncbi:hypothetical protein [Rhodopseudomonas palustris]|uniref:Uncharacterized protein n=1 Tax=Rhodopseudomonas palustris TaxID=1076 RepID=A0A418VDE2_RHOPL|nr:hypothetical protein [Rhodopseudomonas palustris]RJF74009.1 hypothetical protein D4Q52_14215 [Rhodopseudomonas palustris]